MRDVVEWRIHIGAHKTGTTHAQKLLALSRSELAAQGLDYLPREAFRDFSIARKIVKADSGGGSPDEALRRLIEPLRSGPERLLISDESIVGIVPELLTPIQYPRLEQRLGAWRRALQGEKVRLYLSVRDFGGLLTSAYAHAVKNNGLTQPFANLCSQFLEHPPSWLLQIDRIKSVAPDWPICIWRFEDYIKTPSLILQKVTDCRFSKGNVDVPSSTRSPGEHTLSKLRSLNRVRLPAFLRKPIAKKILSAERFEQRFSPLDTESKAALSKLYAEDLERMQSKYPGILIE